MPQPRTFYDRLWNEHIVRVEDDGTALLYVDRHLVHEVTSPQAFEDFEQAGREVWRIAANLAVADHNVPTTGRAEGIADPVSKLKVETLDVNCARHGVTEFRTDDVRQGIVHVIALGHKRIRNLLMEPFINDDLQHEVVPAFRPHLRPAARHRPVARGLAHAAT